ncbi:MAG: MerR family regulatory protein [Solirubrobacteraceae bacterium]|nr:MerR family regulatory protein [Solirubrobacteraceae bacterium]
MAPARPHGRFLAGEAGELAGVSGTTIGQWARRGYIHASQSAGDPHVYSVEDVAEAAVVHALIERGVGRADIRRTIAALRHYGTWPLTRAPLATTTGDGGPRVVLREPDGVYALSRRGWQRLAVEPPLDDLRPAGPLERIGSHRR